MGIWYVLRAAYLLQTYLTFFGLIDVGEDNDCADAGTPMPALRAVIAAIIVALLTLVPRCQWLMAVSL